MRDNARLHQSKEYQRVIPSIDIVLKKSCQANGYLTRVIDIEIAFKNAALSAILIIQRWVVELASAKSQNQ